MKNKPDPDVTLSCPGIEKEILAAMMLDGDILKQCCTRLNEHDFASSSYRKVFTVITELQAAGEPCHPEYVAVKLGDPVLISSLIDAGPVLSTSHTAHFCKLLTQKRRLRSLAKTADWLSENVFVHSADPDALVTELRSKLGL